MSDIINSALMSHLSSFRPSDRHEIDLVLANDATRETALDAMKEFVAIWERADWLEAYSIERIGKWVAKYQPPSVTRNLQDWAAMQDTDARKALLKGISIGLEHRQAVDA